MSKLTTTTTTLAPTTTPINKHTPSSKERFILNLIKPIALITYLLHKAIPHLRILSKNSFILAKNTLIILKNYLIILLNTLLILVCKILICIQNCIFTTASFILKALKCFSYYIFPSLTRSITSTIKTIFKELKTLVHSIIKLIVSLINFTYHKIILLHPILTLLCVTTILMCTLTSYTSYISYMQSNEEESTLTDEIELLPVSVITVHNREQGISEEDYLGFTADVFSIAYGFNYTELGTQLNQKYPDLNVLKIHCNTTPITVTVTYKNLSSIYNNRTRFTIENECKRYHAEIAESLTKYPSMNDMGVKLEVCSDTNTQRTYFIIDDTGVVDYSVMWTF